MRAVWEESELPTRYPIMGCFAGCCASADKDKVRSIEQKTRRIIFAVMELPISSSFIIRTLVLPLACCQVFGAPSIETGTTKTVVRPPFHAMVLPTIQSPNSGGPMSG